MQPERTALRKGGGLCWAKALHAQSGRAAQRRQPFHADLQQQGPREKKLRQGRQSRHRPR